MQHFNSLAPIDFSNSWTESNAVIVELLLWEDNEQLSA